MLLVQAIDEFFNGYFSTHERSAKTRIAYRSDLDQIAAHVGKDFALISLNASFIENWAADLRRRNYSPAFDATKNGRSKSFLLLLGEEGCA